MSEIEEMLFSIIVPVYNAERYLPWCINSIINQTYKKFELILVNDGSTDRSGCLCEHYAKADGRIKVFHKKNEGQLWARYYGLNRASGEFIIWVDSDDYLNSSLIENVYDAVKKYNCQMVIYGFQKVNDRGTVLQMHDFVTEPRVVNNKDFIKLMIGDTCLNSLWCKAHKKVVINPDTLSVLKGVKYGEDLGQSLVTLCNNEIKRVVFIKENLYFYRLNDNSMTQSFYLYQYQDIKKIRSMVSNIIVDRFHNLAEQWEKTDTIYVRSILDYIYRLHINNTDYKSKRQILLEIYSDDFWRQVIRNKYFKLHRQVDRLRFYIYRSKMFTVLYILDLTIFYIKKIIHFYDKVKKG